MATETEAGVANPDVRLMGPLPDCMYNCGRGHGDDPWVGYEAAAVQPCPRVVMLHGGGALGLHGLAQRYPSEM